MRSHSKALEVSHWLPAFALMLRPAELLIYTREGVAGDQARALELAEEGAGLGATTAKGCLHRAVVVALDSPKMRYGPWR